MTARTTGWRASGTFTWVQVKNKFHTKQHNRKHTSMGNRKHSLSHNSTVIFVAYAHSYYLTWKINTALLSLFLVLVESRIVCHTTPWRSTFATHRTSSKTRMELLATHSASLAACANVLFIFSPCKLVNPRCIAGMTCTQRLASVVIGISRNELKKSPVSGWHTGKPLPVVVNLCCHNRNTPLGLCGLTYITQLRFDNSQ